MASSRWIARLLAVGFCPLLLLGAELILRAFGWSSPPVAVEMVVWHERLDEEIRSGESLHRFDRRTLWLPREGAEIPWGPGERVTNLGFRGADPDPEAQVRILILGDSTSFGFGVTCEETYASLTEACLAEHLSRCETAKPGRRPVQVLNAAIVGSTVVQGLARYRVIRESWKPHIVVEAFGAVNEHWPANGLTDVDKIALFEKEEDLGLYLRLRRSSRLVQAVSVVLDRLLSDNGNDAPETFYLKNPDYIRRVSPETFGETLARLRAEVQRDGGQLVGLRTPRRKRNEFLKWPVQDYDPVFAAFIAATGIPVVDAYSAFRADSKHERDLFVDTYHPNGEGHAIIARLLCETLVPLVEERWAAGEGDQVTHRSR